MIDVNRRYVVSKVRELFGQYCSEDANIESMLLSAVNNLKDSEDEELHLLMVDNHIPAGAKLY